MTLNSMTGFARAQGEHDGVSWYFELRSVNGRGLDVRTRLGPGIDSVEAQIRSAVAKKLKRGNVNITLTTQRSQGALEIRVNEAALAQAVAAAKRVSEVADCSPISAQGLLGLKGVLETVEITEDEDAAQARLNLIMQTFTSALDDLVKAREREGNALATIVSTQLDEIERLISVVNNSSARTPNAVRARLKDQLARLMDANTGLDETRLYQEAALLATRYDVEEELKRLEQHVKAGRALLESVDAVGRKLDFLAQEFNREANTLCSKSNDAEVSQAGMALKVVIDQMREQVQNIE